MSEQPSHDIYVRVKNVMRVGLCTTEMPGTDGVVRIDWEPTSGPAETWRLVGVEVLGARGVEIDGLDAVHGRRHGVGPPVERERPGLWRQVLTALAGRR